LIRKQADDLVVAKEPVPEMPGELKELISRKD
jgi:hypothetical protein